MFIFFNTFSQAYQVQEGLHPCSRGAISVQLCGFHAPAMKQGLGAGARAVVVTYVHVHAGGLRL